MSVYRENAFSERVNYAKRCIIARQMDGRAFDTCFEMCDGDCVVVALYRKSLNDPILASRLFDAIDRECALDKVEKYKDVPTNRLYIEARNLREQARIGFAKQQAQWEAERLQQTQQQALKI